VLGLVLGLTSVVAAPTSVIPAASAATPDPVATGSTSAVQRNVMISPHGSWHAVLVNGGASTGQHFLVSADGASWQSISAPDTLGVAAFAISDSGELYAGTANSSTSAYWRYVSGSWSSMATPSLCGSPAQAAALLTDDASLILVSQPNTCTRAALYKSTDDGASWSPARSLGVCGNGARQVALVDGIVHMLCGSGSVSYERWDVATAQPLPVDAPPNAPRYQWSPYMFALPGTPSTLYIAAMDNNGGLYVYKTADGGKVWITSVTADPFPVEFGRPDLGAPFDPSTQVGFSMGTDGRIDVLTASYSSGSVTLLEVTHDPDVAGNWSAVTTFGTVPGDSADIATWPTQQVDAGQPYALDAWVSVPHGSGTYDLYWFNTPGTTIVPPLATATRTTTGSTVEVGLGSTPPGLTSVAASPGHVWQVALIGQTIYRSQDGVHWSLIPNPTDRYLRSVAVSDTGEVYTVTNQDQTPYYSPTDVYRYINGRWFGPIAYAQGSANSDSGPMLIVRMADSAGSGQVRQDLLGIESPSGRISYSTDDGSTWVNYSGLAPNYGRLWSYAVVGDVFQVVYGSAYKRWSRTTRSELTVTTPPIIPAGATQVTLLPDRSNDNDIWLAYLTSTGALALDHSVDGGDNWTTVDPGSALPSGYTATSMAMGDDGRLYLHGSSSPTGTNLARVSRALAPSPDWSAVTVRDTQLGGSTFTALPTAAAIPAPPDVWMLAATPGSSPTTYELHHYGKLGGPAPIPDAQTYGPASAPPIFAMRPVSAQSDPVSSATGSFTDQITDATLPALGEPLTMTRTYNSADATIGPLGRGWTFNYATTLDVSAVDATLRAGDGQQVIYTRNADGTFAGPPGSLATLVKNADGTYLATTKRREHYQFDSAGRLISLTDRNSQGSTLSYNGSGQLASVSGSSRTLNFDYNTDGTLSQVTLPDGRYVHYGYTNGLLTDVRDLGGQHTVYGYDDGGRLASILDANSHYPVRNTYDPATGRVTDQQDARGNHTTFSWDPYTQTQTMTAPDGGVWKDVYNGNVLVKQVDPLKRTTTYSYDQSLNLVATTDPAGDITSFSYDADGNILTETDADGAQSSYTYNNLDEQKTSTNPRNLTVTYSYDGNGNPTGTSRPDPNSGTGGAITTGATYDPVTGQLATSTDARGKTTHYDYYGNGDLKTVTDPLGNKTSYGYDTSGRRTSAVSPRGNAAGANPADYTTTYSYYDNDQLHVVTDPLGHANTYSYDNVGNLHTVQDANQHTTTYSYNEANQVQTVQPADPSTPATGYDYDVNDRLKTSTAPYVNGTLTTQYDYDQAGQLTTLTTPLGGWTYQYNKMGDRTITTDPAGNTTTVGYDPMHRVSSISYSDGTPSISYGYNPDGYRTSMSDGSGTVSYGYDSLDRLTSVTRGSSTFTYGYDKAGHVTARTYPGQSTDSYDYDDDGRLWHVTGGGVVQATYGYDEDSNLKTTTFPTGNGYVETRTYDNADRLTNIVDAAGRTTLSRAGYTLDNVGNPTQITDATGATNTYNYDNLDRLTKACSSTTTCTGAANYINWSYDAAGNRLSETRPTGTTNYTYNAKDELTKTVGPSGTVNYGYDNNGNQTSAGTATATFNAANQMTTSVTGSSTTSYRYDGNGRRLSETTGSTTTQLLWDPISYQLAEELNGSGTLLRRYLFGNGLIDMSEPAASGGPFYYHVDGQGSVLAITNAAGSTQWKYAYDPYGAVRSTTKVSNKAPTNLIGWIGQYSDNPTGKTLLRARMYDTGTGRFTSPDPAGSGDTYGYGNANPLLYADPNGTDPNDPFNNGLDPEASDIANTLLSACASGDWNCNDAYQTASQIQYGTQLAGMVAENGTLKCISGKGSCTGTAINVAIFAAGSIDGGDLAVIGLDAARAERAAEAVAGGDKFIYGQRVLDRAAEESGKYHNFPASLDGMILSGDREVVNEGYIQYTAKGAISGVRGTYEIGTRPSGLADAEVIVHRFFRPE
jgi:RHS repeat-associated protein